MCCTLLCWFPRYSLSTGTKALYTATTHLTYSDYVPLLLLCSEWFDFFDGERLVNMSDTQLYKEDWIGLRRLDEAGRIVRGQVLRLPHR